jgi:peptidylprolyl isomerase
MRAIIQVALFLMLVFHGCSSGEDPKIRERMVQIARWEDMGTLGPKRDLPTLMFHQSVEIRKQVVLALGRIEDASVIEEMAKAATLDTLPMYSTAAWAMGQLGPITNSDAAADFLTGIFKDTTSETRRNVMDGLGKLNDPDIPGFMALFGLSDGSAVVRGAAAIAMWRLDDKEHLRDLIARLRDPEVEVRWRTAFALWRLKNPAARADLERVLHDDDARVRMFAARGLGQVGDSASADSLIPLLDDPDWRVRNDAAGAIGSIGKSDRALDALVAHLANEANELTAKTMAEGVGKAHRPQDKAALFGLIKRRSGTVWTGMVNGLAAGFPDDAGEAARAMLIDNRSWVRVAAISALGAAQTEGARAVLTNAYGSLSEAEKGFALSALAEYDFGYVEPNLDAALQSKNEVLAQSALEVLSKSPDTASARRLGDFWQRHAADTTSDLKVGALQTAAALIDTNAALGSVLEPWLTSALDDKDRLVRTAAIEALAKKGVDSSARLGEFETSITDESFNAIFRAYKKNPTATITTDRGDITIELRYDKAPRTVHNFVTLAEKGFYNGLIFHRVVPNFVVQGGDPTGTGFGGPGYTIRSQYNDLEYSAGAVGMASSGKDTEGSQFFITHSPQPHLDDRYTLFGYVTSGQDVVDQIRLGDKIKQIVTKK